MIEIQLILIFIILAVATITDIKSREVPDWLNYSGIAVGFAASAMVSIATANITPLWYSALGFSLFFGIGCVMFYTGQWGGGDSKMLMALGSLMGFKVSLHFPFVDLGQLMIAFWGNMLIAGVAYALFWSIIVAARNRERFTAQLRVSTAKIMPFKLLTIGIAAALIFFVMLIEDTLIRTEILALLAVIATTAVLWVFAKTVEKSCMIKSISPEKLTEGDWIAEEVRDIKKYVCGPKDLGIDKKQIQQLIMMKKQKKIKTVLVKEGIPFIPSFLIAFIITAQFGNLFLLLIRV